MFEWTFDDTFSFFITDNSNKKYETKRWEDFQSEYLSQFSILTELKENGFADYTEFTCEVEVLKILELSDVEKQILFLPNPYPYEIFIESDGQLNISSFKFKYGFYDFVPNGNRFNIKRVGPLVKFEEREYLLSSNQYLVCKALDEFNSLSETERTFKHNLKCFADIKTLSQAAAIILDSYLTSENVFLPDKIKIEINFESEILEIIPTIDIENGKKFTAAFDSSRNVRDIYPITEKNGNRTRVIIDDNLKEQLGKIKKTRKVTDKDLIREIVEHPENFFNDDQIDISVFYSARVKEIGIYKPKFYPFVCPYKSEWIPGIIIKDKVDGEKRIHFKTSTDLDEFESEKQAAQKVGKKEFEWKGTEIPIDEADKFIRIARKQFENKKEPVQISAREDSKDNEVLISWENADFLDYDETGKQISTIKHTFYPINNFISSIQLKDHQVEGIAWLQALMKENVRGCLLADDMGLGKTLQLLYFIEWHSQQSNSSTKPYLIVAPVTLLENWENEYKKFFSKQNLSIKLLYGTSDLSKVFNKDQVDKLQRKQIILTNYETLRTYQFNLCAVDYAVVVLDEAQKIKTPGTLVTNVSKALKSDFKISMTGTPVENTLVDLWCIMDFSVPGLLGNAKDFAKEFQNPLKSVDTDIIELGERLRSKIGVFIKRRLKVDVAKDLPPKFDNEKSRIKKEMPPIQFEQYKAEIERAKNSDLNGIERRNQILKSLWAIRDISDHPYLVNSQILNFSSEELISSSAKLSIMIDLLSEIQSKEEKVIVFADRKETQKMLKKVIYDSFGISPSIINGDTPTIKQHEGKTKLSRQQTIDRFQNEDGFNVIVLSQLAAGTGLNITEANHVIHFTRHWNPAKEEQATDRAYRIGQKRDVHVYYPMAVFPDVMKNEDGKKQNSFDEVLDILLNKKKMLATSTLFPSEQAEVRPDEIFNDVFGCDSESVLPSLTVQQIDKLNPILFEAFWGALLIKQGFATVLTPYQNDKGADLIATKENIKYLIQSKQSNSQIPISAIQEIVGAKAYYESRFNENYSLAVSTNSFLTKSASVLATDNRVVLFDRNYIIENIQKYPVTISDVNSQEQKRLNNI